jgi:hypothetical protein
VDIVSWAAGELFARTYMGDLMLGHAYLSRLRKTFTAIVAYSSCEILHSVRDQKVSLFGTNVRQLAFCYRPDSSHASVNPQLHIFP